MCDEKKLLEDVRALLREHVLPRHTQLEEEVRLLRGVTWPVCQSLTVENNLQDIERKRLFLENGTKDMEEVHALLDTKWKLCGKRPTFSGSANKQEELRRINDSKKNIRCISQPT